jgi:hypothetical protein
MPSNGLHPIGRTCRVVAARRWKQRRQQPLVEPNQSQKKPLHAVRGFMGIWGDSAAPGAEAYEAHHTEPNEYLHTITNLLPHNAPKTPEDERSRMFPVNTPPHAAARPRAIFCGCCFGRPPAEISSSPPSSSPEEATDSARGMRLTNEAANATK